MEEQRPQGNGNNEEKFQTLPLAGGAAAGYLIGAWAGFGGLVGLGLGFLIVDSLGDLRVTHRAAVEARHLAKIGADLLKTKLPSRSRTATDPSTPDQEQGDLDWSES